MFEFLAGLALGTAFAPFWMMIWNRVVSPAITQALKKDAVKK